jgi:hypothetical protein
MNKLRPETIERLACFAEKAGLLAAAVIRQQPNYAYNVACTLFYTVMTSFCYSYDTGAHQLRESNAYHAFDEAWRDACKNAMADLVPNPPHDKSSLN